MPFLVLLLSYLLGSLIFGLIYSRLQGQDIRDKDLPGASGTWRQYGRGPAIIVTLLDMAKGAAAIALAGWLAPGWEWLAMGGVVAGHCYPLYFRFDGGGGLAPFGGALLAHAPLTFLGVLVMIAVLVPLYRATLQPRLKLNAVPAVSIVLLPLAVWLGTATGGWQAIIAAGVVMLVRALHMLATPRVA